MKQITDHEFVPAPFYPERCDARVDVCGRIEACGRTKDEHRKAKARREERRP